MLLSILLSVMISGGAPCIELCACRFNGDRPRAAMGAVPVCYHYLSSLIVNTTNTMIIIFIYYIINTMLLSIKISAMISGGAPCVELCACWEFSRCNWSSTCLLSLFIIAHHEYYQHDDYYTIVLYYQYNIIIHVIVDNCCRRSSGHPLPAARRRRGAGPARPAVAARALGGDYKNKTLLYFY